MAVIGVSVAKLSAKNLPPFPPAAARLMRMLSKDDTSFAEVAKILMTDAALSAEVLRMANSPLGGRFGAKTILQALSLLGVIRVSGLVVTLGVSQFLKKAGARPLVRRAWRHNLASALAAKQIAPEFDVDPDCAYVAALLHDIGRLVLMMNDMDGYEGVADASRDNRELERERYGIDHCEAGAWLIAEWNLPELYAAVARRHHDTFDSDDPLVNVTRIGCGIANHMGFSVAERKPDNVSALVNEDSGYQLAEEVSYQIAATINAVECEYGL